MHQPQEPVSEVSFQLQYAGASVESGLMNVRDLAPALLAVGDLCEQANYEVNGATVKASVQVRAPAPGSVIVVFVLNVGIPATIALTMGLNPISTAKDVLALLKNGIEIVKLIGGRKIESATQLENGMTRLVIEHTGTVEHKITHDVPGHVMSFLNKRSVQADMKSLASPLKAEGVEVLNVIEENEIIETVSAEDVHSFDDLSVALPSADEQIIEETSTIEKSFTVVTISSDPRNYWRLTDGRNSLSVKVDDRALHEAAKAGQLGIEPGFIVKARIKSETRWVSGKPETVNHLVKILNVKPPEPRQEEGESLF